MFMAAKNHLKLNSCFHIQKYVTTLIDKFKKNSDMILYRILFGKPEGKRPLGRPRRRWVDSIIKVLR
jgi:hypothetical protein